MIIELWFDPRDSWARFAREDLRTALADPQLAGFAADAEILWRPAQPEPVAAASSGGGRQRLAGHDARRLLVLATRAGGSEASEKMATALLDAAQSGLDLDDEAVLVGIAAQAALPEAAGLLFPSSATDGADTTTDSSADTSDRDLTELLAIGRALGATRSPTLSVGDRVLPGVQSPAAIVDFLTEAAADRTPPEEIRRLRWAESLLAAQDPLGALAVIGPLLTAHPDDRNLLRVAGRAYFHSAQLARARESLTRLVDADPDDAYARLMLGRTLQRLGSADEAAVHLRIAQAMAPDLF